MEETMQAQTKNINATTLYYVVYAEFSCAKIYKYTYFPVVSAALYMVRIHSLS